MINSWNLRCKFYLTNWIFVQLIIFLFLLIRPSYSTCQGDDSSKYVIVESMPLYNGIDAGPALREYFKDNFIYPEFAIKNNISGKVYVSFTIDANSWVKRHVTNIYVIKGVHPSIDYAAVYMVKNIPDKWLPGRSRGIDEPVRYIFPFVFDIKNVPKDNITDSLDSMINRLCLMDSLTLDSILYRNKPVEREWPPHYENKTVTIEEKNPNEFCTISGRVFDNDGNPLYGAVVLVTGTTKGTSADKNGFFTLTVEKGREISISYVGLITGKITVTKNQKKLKIILKDDVRNIYE